MLELRELDDSIEIINKYHNLEKSIIKLGDRGIDVHAIGDGHSRTASFRYHEFSNILKHAVENVIRDWNPPTFNPATPKKNKRGKPIKLDDEALIDWKKRILGQWKTKTLVPKYCKVFSQLFKPLWQKLLTQADPELVRLDKALCHAAGLKKVCYYHWIDFQDKIKKAGDYAVKDAINFLPATLFYYHTKYSPDTNKPKRYHTSLNLTDKKDWKEYYAVEDVYSQLTKTLAAIKYPVQFDVLSKLRAIRLERPLLTRTELFSALAVVESRRNRRDVIHIVYKSDRKQILKAFRLYNKLTGNNLKANAFKAFNEFWTYLSDYPEEYHGTVCGLVKRSFEWHERQARENLARRATQHKILQEQKTKLPPFDITKLNEKVRFLDSVAALHDEGAEMGHCVANYAHMAVRGECYIFAINHEKERATLELRPDLRINQCQGPHNKKNEATKWATRYILTFLKKHKVEPAKAVAHDPTYMREIDEQFEEELEF